MRKSVLVVTAVFALVAIAVGLWLAGRKAAAPVDVSVEPASDVPPALSAPEPIKPPQAATVSAVEDKPSDNAPPRSVKAAASTPGLIPSRPEPSPYTRQLVASLQLDPSQGRLTPERAAQWKTTLQQLVEQGSAAVPAISEFLEKNLDYNFASLGEDLLGKTSLRTALLEALQAIGGPEALSALAQTLQTTSDPREIAWLARNLEQQAPEQYRQMAVAAANEALGMAAAGKLAGRDVAPLFEVLQQYGGPGAAAELAKAAEHWNYYAAITLANLPEGAGIPALAQIVQDPDASVKGTRVAALQMLAQLAAFYPQARDVLLEQARSQKIPPGSWSAIASALGGDFFQMGKPTGVTTPAISGNIKTYHLAHGDQNYFSASMAAGWTPAQINDQLALINRFLALNPPPSAAQSLQSSYATLSGLLSPPK